MLWGSSFHSRKPPPRLPTSPAEPLALRCIHPGSLSRSLFRVCCLWGFPGPGSPCAELTNPAFQGLPSRAGTEKGPTDGNALCRFTQTPCTGHTDFGVRTGSMTCPLPACRRTRWAGRGQTSRGVRGQLRPEPPRRLRLWRRPRPEPPHGLQGAAQGPEVTHLFFLNNSVYSFILAVPSLDCHGGFSPELGRGLLLAAASPAAETGSGRRGRQELRLRALPARQWWCLSCSGLWGPPGSDLSPALAGRFFASEACPRSHTSDICQLCWAQRLLKHQGTVRNTPERPSRSSYPRGS